MKTKARVALLILVCCFALGSLAWRGPGASGLVRRHVPDAAGSSGISPLLNLSTFLGGSEEDEIDGIAVDASGNVYVVLGLRSRRNFFLDIPFL